MRLRHRRPALASRIGIGDREAPESRIGAAIVLYTLNTEARTPT